MKIGLIADDFTRINLEMESALKVVNLSPLSWWIDLRIHTIDLLLVESAWLGYKGKWRRKVASYDDVMHQQLRKLLKHCNENNIATVFWNKEDPVNHHRFKHNIDMFNVCLTTEEKMLAVYQKNFKGLSDVAVAPFFFQPNLHNPEPAERLAELNHKVVFCGGLYEKEFPDRSRRLKESIEVIGNGNVVVYDRFNGEISGWNGLNGVEVKAPFAYQDSKNYYQSGMAQLNANSVDGSSTMYSRRMIELIACGAKVIDITRCKNNSVLSPFVIQVTNEKEIIKALETEAVTVDFSYLMENFSAARFLKNLEKYI